MMIEVTLARPDDTGGRPMPMPGGPFFLGFRNPDGSVQIHDWTPPSADPTKAWEARPRTKTIYPRRDRRRWYQASSMVGAALRAGMVLCLAAALVSCERAATTQAERQERFVGKCMETYGRDVSQCMDVATRLYPEPAK